MRPLTLGIITLVLAIIVAVIGFCVGESWSDRARPQVATASSHKSPMARPTVSPTRSESSSDVPAWTAVAEKFVAAFLDTSPARVARLRASASPRLTRLLARTDPAKVPKAQPIGRPSLVGEHNQIITVDQRLSDGSAFAFDLVLDPGRTSGWVVTSVRPGER